DLGRQVNIPTIPQRIVSLAPSTTEILFALDLGDRVMGVDDFSDFPPEAKAKPKLGAPFPGFNIENIVDAEPDLILSVRGTYVEQLEARGLQVVVLEPQDMDHVLRNIELVGRIAGAQGKAKEVVTDMKKRLARVRAKTSAASVIKPRVFYEVDATDPTKPWTAGPGSFIDALITDAGGQNIAASRKELYFQISAEKLISQNPQIILLADTEFGVSVETAIRRAGWGGIEAVKKEAIYPIGADITSRPGPRLVEGLEAMARLIHPELFQ
ncbi:MAG: cobalamin-binding protein, partial [Chloroflexota bacterium]